MDRDAVEMCVVWDGMGWDCVYGCLSRRGGVLVCLWMFLGVCVYSEGLDICA
jgi:hypothetical protein